MIESLGARLVFGFILGAGGALILREFLPQAATATRPHLKTGIRAGVTLYREIVAELGEDAAEDVAGTVIEEAVVLL